MKVADAFKKAFFYALSCFDSRLYGKPGDVIKRMSPEEREALQNLTATDINHRVDDIKELLPSKQDYQKKSFVQLKLDFDKKINM